MTSYHISVLLNESLESLNIRPSGFYIDCTLGEAGHSIEILKKLNKEGLLLSIDQDNEAIQFVTQKYERNLEQSSWILRQGNFASLKKVLVGIDRKPDGILMDLGISSRQLALEGRGFSYQNETDPLDMRMDDELKVLATDLLNVLSEKQLTKLFYEYGEERYAPRIAKAIKASTNGIKTVGDLTSLIYKVVPATARRGDSHHPARRVFQALRIAVNDELGALKQGLEESFELLNSQGRLVVITFHSLEDRIVKTYFKSLGTQVKLLVEGQPPTEEEVKLNKRAHSAKLRVIEKI
ncbi:16S rRNA (cytosine(1402)-N(4))-methyltransferase RsmH [bacterium]|nr:16S rRNA (cytosine(1402)-N(4))-methyltransferase RsmH [bacterium]